MKRFRDLDLDPSSRERWIVLFVALNMHRYRIGIRFRNWSEIKRSEDVGRQVVIRS